MEAFKKQMHNTDWGKADAEVTTRGKRQGKGQEQVEIAEIRVDWFSGFPLYVHWQTVLKITGQLGRVISL